MDNFTAFTDVELNDEDILDAMRQISGYVDITFEDFRAIYHLAHQHAMQRMFATMAKTLLTTSCAPYLTTAMTLDRASRILNNAACPGLPVVDDTGRLQSVLLHKEFFPALQEQGDTP